MKSILIVDDEPNVSRVTRHCLERAGYEVEIAPDGIEALERLEWRAFDAVVTDIMMPRMSGRELCLAIREKWPNLRLPIVLITSSLEGEHREWASRVRDAVFMEKPVSLHALTSRLEQLLADAAEKAEEVR